MAHRRNPFLVSAILVSLTTATTSCTGNDSQKSSENTSAQLRAADSTSSTTSPQNSASPKSTQKAQKTSRNDVPFFDQTSVHSMNITVDKAAYDKLIERYRADGSKAWIKAKVTIDGEPYRQAGMRLKGNSSLFGIGGPGLRGLRADAVLPAGVAGGRGPGGPGGSADVTKPESLPWLIRLDKYIDDQAHQGITEFVVRSSTTKTAINEIVALELLDRAGLASEKSASVRLRVNSGSEMLRLVIESPNQKWMEDRFGPKGMLYKADSSGDYSYRGTDPASYSEAWSQEAGEEDIRPLIEFLRFVNESTDSEFESQLPKRLDVASFATYLAIQELFNNFDDIDGPGNNSYLHYDTSAQRFTVVPWDHNLAFIGLPFGGAGPFGAFDATADPTADPALDADLGGLLPTADTETATDSGVGLPDRPGIGAGGFPEFLRKDNALVSRFHNVASFEAKYDAALEKLRSTVFGDNAKSILKRRAAVISSGASDLIDPATITEESATVEAALKG